MGFGGRGKGEEGMLLVLENIQTDHQTRWRFTYFLHTLNLPALTPSYKQTKHLTRMESQRPKPIANPQFVLCIAV